MSGDQHVATRLIGRTRECGQLDDLVLAVRDGDSRALLLLGDPGIGKSALIDHVVRDATAGMQVLRVSGIQTEMELAFAGLHQLLGGTVEHLDRLPPPQRRALRVVFRIDEGTAPDPLTIALGVLGLLTELSADRPLLCVVDDVQWLDSASVQALAFAARRIESAAVGFLLASREPVEILGGIPTTRVRGLDPRDARALLDSALHGPLDQEVRARIVTETAGNPLALLELPRSVGRTELAGGFALPGVAPLSDRIEAGYRGRFDALPADTRWMVVLAAADPVGDPILLWAAADHVGLDAEAITPAVAEGLLEVGTRTRFTHPLARSAVYRSAEPDVRRAVHRALAAVTDADQDPDRRAWHRAQAAVGPDEETAAQLEQSALRARSRGGIAAAAAFLERAAALTPAAGTRVGRLIAAAGATAAAGEFEHALEMLDTASHDRALTGAQSARIALARGQIAFGQYRGTEAVELLVDAAHRLKRFGLPEADGTVLEAAALAIWITPAPDHVELIRSAASIIDRPGDEPASGSGLEPYVESLRARVVDGYAAAAPALGRALNTVLSDTAARDTLAARLGTLWYMLSLPIEMWDEPSWDLLSTYQADVAREAGALTSLKGVLMFTALHHIHRGDLRGAELALDEADSLSLTPVRARAHIIRAVLRAWRGDEDEMTELLDALRSAGDGGQDGGLGKLDRLSADCAEAVLCNSRGRFADAHRAARETFLSDPFPWGPLVIGELAEAAARIGETADLGAALEWIETRADATPTPWCLGMAERIRALATDGEAAREHYARSIEHLERSAGRSELARSHLLFGEWLRRHGGRGEARRELAAADQMFTDMGAAGFAARATRELRTLGEQPGRVEASDELTAQERNVAELAATGLTNPEIAATMFLSPRTVQYHLRKIFIKLAITSRVELKQALERGPGTGARTTS